MSERHRVGWNWDWNAVAWSKRSLTAWGAGWEAVPTSSDDVFLDAASWTVTVRQYDAVISCKNLNLTWFTWTFNPGLYWYTNIYWDITLSPTATLWNSTYSQPDNRWIKIFWDCTFTSNGKTWYNRDLVNNWYVLQLWDAMSQGWKLYSAFGVNPTYKTNWYSLTIWSTEMFWTNLQIDFSNSIINCAWIFMFWGSTWSLVNMTWATIICNTFRSNNISTAVLNITNSIINTWDLTLWVAASLQNITVTGSTIKCTGNFLTTVVNRTFNNVELNWTTQIVKWNWTFNDLKIWKDWAQTIQFTDWTDQTVTTFTCVWSAWKVKTLTWTGTWWWKLSDTTWTNTVDYVDMSYCTGEWWAAWIASYNSIDSGNNHNRTFLVPTADFTYTTTIRTIQFTDASLWASSYSWDFWDWTTSTSASPSHTFWYWTFTVTLTINGNPSYTKSVSFTFIEPTVSTGWYNENTDTCNREIWVMLQRRKFYDDPLNNTKYYADAPRWTSLSDTKRRVMKIVQTKVFGVVVSEETTYTAGYNNPATNLSVVQSLTYI